MATKTLQTRIIIKHDTEANWIKVQSFIPKAGEVIIYDIDDDHDYERIKIGDGKTTITNLPFTVSEQNKKLLDKTAHIYYGVDTNSPTATLRNIFIENLDIDFVEDDNVDGNYCVPDGTVFLLQFTQGIRTREDIEISINGSDPMILSFGGVDGLMFTDSGTSSGDWVMASDGVLLCVVSGSMLNATIPTKVYESAKAYKDGNDEVIVDTYARKDHAEVNKLTAISSKTTDMEVTETLRANRLTNAYIGLQNDNNTIPAVFNELAYITKLGGSVSCYTTLDTDLTAASLTKAHNIRFPEAVVDNSIGLADIVFPDTEDTLVIDISLPKTYYYIHHIYMDFSQNIYMSPAEVYIYTSLNSETYTLKHSKISTKNRMPYFRAYFTTSDTGIDRIRFVLKNPPANRKIRLQTIGYYNYRYAKNSSIGLGGTSELCGDIIPYSNSTVKLGSADKRLSVVYADDFADSTGSIRKAGFAGISDLTDAALLVERIIDEDPCQFNKDIPLGYFIGYGEVVLAAYEGSQVAHGDVHEFNSNIPSGYFVNYGELASAVYQYDTLDAINGGNASSFES